MRHTVLTAALLTAALAPSRAHAQKKWTQIGTTSSGNPVFVDPKSVKKTGDLVSATVKIVFSKPVATPKGEWFGARTIATYDCARKSLAAKEQVYYGDKAETKIVERKVNKIPGYGPALGGSLGAIALEYLCRAK
ncbi:MAG: surface-adhesin E family protein [bacterium]